MFRTLLPASTDALWLYSVQFVFLFTGVFSTCVAQYVFYQGAGDQRAMLLPLCNFLGIMLVGLIPVSKSGSQPSAAKAKAKSDSIDVVKPVEILEVIADIDNDDEPERTGVSAQTSGDSAWESEEKTLIRRPGGTDSSGYDTDTDTDSSSTFASSPSSSMEIKASQSSVYCSVSTVQLCIGLSVVLDFAGCIFSNIGLAMAGSGLYQVLYSSVICWSALLSRCILKKVVSKEEWTGIALVTFGLAFSALGHQSGSDRNHTVVLMGCFNSLLGAAFYGGNYVTGEYMLKLPERPQPQDLCLKIGSACMVILGIYQAFYVLPMWNELVTKPIQEANGNTTYILAALIGYTLSQLAHGLTYFMMLGSSGAVTTGIMQSLRAVCVFILSSLLYCSYQESQCFDMKRGVATLIVVCGVMFYSWAKSQAKAAPSGLKSTLPGRRSPSKLIAGKNFVV